MDTFARAFTAGGNLYLYCEHMYRTFDDLYELLVQSMKKKHLGNHAETRHLCEQGRSAVQVILFCAISLLPCATLSQRVCSPIS
jgi:hypothetical protein